jgi:predicted  nucleic acid-binding Zn-ribbon protein
MDASHELLQYVTPAIIAACAAALVGIIPYFLTKRESIKEKAEADKTAVETARLMYEGLAVRVTQLETENDNLRKQLNIMQSQNAYMADLEITKGELEQHVDELTGRISTLERTLKIVIDAFRKYISNPGIDGGDQMIELLRDIENQMMR